MVLFEINHLKHLRHKPLIRRSVCTGELLFILEPLRLRAKKAKLHNCHNDRACSPIDLNVRVQLWHKSGYLDWCVSLLVATGRQCGGAVLLVMEDEGILQARWPVLLSSFEVPLIWFFNMRTPFVSAHRSRAINHRRGFTMYSTPDPLPHHNCTRHQHRRGAKVRALLVIRWTFV